MDFFLVVYTSAHLIGAVSYPLPSKKCEEAVKERISLEEWRLNQYPDEQRYTFVCEQHKSRPKVQTKIQEGDRERFESDCFNLHGGYPKCQQLPNGDANFVGGIAGQRNCFTIKFRDRLKDDFIPDIKPCQ